MMNVNSYLFTTEDNLDAIFDAMSIRDIYKNNYPEIGDYEGVLFFKAKDYQQLFRKYSDRISSLLGIGEEEKVYSVQLFLESDTEVEKILVEGLRNTYLLKSDIDIFSMLPLGYWSVKKNNQVRTPYFSPFEKI